jgi:GNAT superfamily N-acetyltransferase
MTAMNQQMTSVSQPVNDRIHIEILHERKSEVCREILEALPEWFGIPEAIDSYAKGVAELPMLVAKDTPGMIIGFIALKPQTPSAVEAYVLGIRREWHRKGCGRLLFEAGEKIALDLGAKFLTVKTLASSHPDPHYKATRLFYEAIGFVPIEVFPDLWSPKHPCLLMAKTLR